MANQASISTSDVWNHYEKLQDAKRVKCMLCSKELAYHGGTSNLRDHLLKIHPLDYRTKQRRLHKLHLTVLRFLARYCGESRSKEITDRIVNMVAMDMRPMHAIECVGFRELVPSLEPGYKLLSQKLMCVRNKGFPRASHWADHLREDFGDGYSFWN